MGVGHLFRAMRIVSALVAAGMDVDLVQGGEPVPGLDPAGATVHQLAPLRAGSSNFSDLEMPDGEVADDEYRQSRRKHLLDIFERTQPDVIITEAFPFGRRQMRFEILPLLDAARARRRRPKVVASIRDILQENRRPGRDAETAEYIERYYDHVLVHSDPALVRLEATYPFAGRIADRTLYTGFVTPEAASTGTDVAEFDVVVSVGGGVMGRDLLFAAAAAQRLSSLRDARWCIITGINTPERDVAQVRALASPSATVERFLPDLRAVIAKARISISRAGYNTIADIFRAQCRAIVAPLSDGEETEQLRRTELLSAAGLIDALDPEDETPEGIAAAIESALARPVPDRSGVRLDGADFSAKAIMAMLDGTLADTGGRRG